MQFKFKPFSTRGKEYTIQKKMLFFCVLQILQDTFMKLNHIQETNDINAHSRQERMMFLVALLSRKVIKLIQIKEAHKIKAQGWHDTRIFFQCNYCQKKMC